MYECSISVYSCVIITSWLVRTYTCCDLHRCFCRFTLTSNLGRHDIVYTTQHSVLCIPTILNTHHLPKLHGATKRSLPIQRSVSSKSALCIPIATADRCTATMSYVLLTKPCDKTPPDEAHKSPYWLKSCLQNTCLVKHS
jgi:hypothetical protein